MKVYTKTGLYEYIIVLWSESMPPPHRPIGTFPSLLLVDINVNSRLSGQFKVYSYVAVTGQHLSRDKLRLFIMGPSQQSSEDELKLRQKGGRGHAKTVLNGGANTNGSTEECLAGLPSNLAGNYWKTKAIYRTVLYCMCNAYLLWRACNLTAFIHSSTSPVVHPFASRHEGPGLIPRGVLMWNRDSPISVVSLHYTLYSVCILTSSHRKYTAFPNQVHDNWRLMSRLLLGPVLQQLLQVQAVLVPPNLLQVPSKLLQMMYMLLPFLSKLLMFRWLIQVPFKLMQPPVQVAGFFPSYYKCRLSCCSSRPNCRDPNCGWYCQSYCWGLVQVFLVPSKLLLVTSKLVQVPSRLLQVPFKLLLVPSKMLLTSLV